MVRADIFIYELRKMIKSKIDSLTEQIVNSYAVSGWAEYNRISGELSGFRQTLLMIDDAMESDTETGR